MDNNYVTIIDSTGRNILGVLTYEDPNTLGLTNPVMITVQPQNNQFQVQLIPLFLSEFIAYDDNTKRNFTYLFNKSNIAIGKDFSIDARIITQYQKVIETANTAKSAPAPDTAGKPEVIKLFEE